MVYSAQALFRGLFSFSYCFSLLLRCYYFPSYLHLTYCAHVWVFAKVSDTSAKYFYVENPSAASRSELASGSVPRSVPCPLCPPHCRWSVLQQLFSATLL